MSFAEFNFSVILSSVTCYFKVLSSIMLSITNFAAFYAFYNSVYAYYAVACANISSACA